MRRRLKQIPVLGVLAYLIFVLVAWFMGESAIFKAPPPTGTS